MTTLVQDHYGSRDIVARILAAIPWSQDDGTSLAASQLFPFDQLHGRELMATIDHAARLNPASDAHLLDIGSGLGGPARYIAATFGCRVTGIDLTPDFVAAATDLTRLCGLGDRADFLQGDATGMPFEADTFDQGYCFYVGMNLPDKTAVLAECARVLRPGAMMIWTEVTGADGDPHYPLPWARSADASHVEGREALLGRFAATGFELVSVDDETDAHLELARRARLSGITPKPEQIQANQVVLGPDFVERRGNYIKSLQDGSIASTVIVVRKPLVMGAD